MVLRFFAYLVACKITNELLSLTRQQKKTEYSRSRKQGYTIKYIVNTHSHIDHIMGNRRMKELTGADIIIHEKEAGARSAIARYDADVPCQTISSSRHYCQRWRFHHNRKDIIKGAQYPGTHREASVCITMEWCLPETHICRRVGRTDLGGGSLQQLVSSIRNKLFVLPDDTIVAPVIIMVIHPRAQ